MILKHIAYSIAITFGSWTLGLILATALRKTQPYRSASNLNFLKNETLNRAIGVGVVKWVVKNTPFKYFNQKLKLTGKAAITDLHTLRDEMTFAEMSHWLAFVAVAVYATVKCAQGQYVLALIMMLSNIVLNAYPSLLQQENKRRIDRLIARFSVRSNTESESTLR